MDRLNRDCRRRAGFTNKLGRLKPRASEKMGGGGLSRIMRIFFFSSPILSVEKTTSEDGYTFF